MQFHELACSSFLCLSSSQEFRSACFTFRGHWRLQSASEVIQLYAPGLRLSRAFRIGMALGIWLQIIVSRELNQGENFDPLEWAP